MKPIEIKKQVISINHCNNEYVIARFLIGHVKHITIRKVGYEFSDFNYFSEDEIDFFTQSKKVIKHNIVKTMLGDECLLIIKNL